MIRKTIQIAILLLLSSQINQWITYKNQRAKLQVERSLNRGFTSTDNSKDRNLAFYNEKTESSELDQQLTEEIKKILKDERN